MKKIYFIGAFLASVMSFGQNPIITAIIDGPCTGGLPKVCEIYANGTVDFTQFTFQNQTNANTTWGANLALTPLGTRTNEFVYVILTGTPANLSLATNEFPSITASNSIESNTMNLNGDDRVRIINTATSSVIDQFGVSDVDGTGTTWEWLDTYAKRNNGTGPDGAFVQANWTIGPIDNLDGDGTCNGQPALQTIVPLGQFTLSNARIDNISGLKVYPNPAKNTLYVTSDSFATKQVELFDVLGKSVLNTKVVNNTVNISSLSKGVYVAKITEEGKTATRKVVVE